MAVRKKLETRSFNDLVPVGTKRGVYVNREALTSLAQHGAPSKIFPVYLLILKNQKIKEFDLPDVVSPLPIAEEVPQSPNLLDVGRWLDSIDSSHDAMYAVQIGVTILNRLPESYKAKLPEGL